MKKLISVLILLSMLVGILASCSNNNDDNEVSKIVFEDEEITITVGESLKLEPLIYPKSARDSKLEWESSNEKVATVSRGKVKGVSEGTTIISATAENGESAVCRVTVVAASSDSTVDDAYLEVMPGAIGFSAVDITKYSLPSTVKEAYRETNGKGYVIKLETRGYNSGFVILVGVTLDGIVTGAKCIASNETNKQENSYGANFVGKDLAGVSAVDLVAGSTMTTEAYRNAVIDAINTGTILSGVSVDFRTEEEKFADALKAALPEANGGFTKLFIFDAIPNVIDSIYKADNGAGYVCVIGNSSEGEFIGIGKDGKAVNSNGSYNENYAEIAVARLTSGELYDIDVTEYKNHTDKNIKSIFKNINYVKKTSSDSYVVEICANGYGAEKIVVLVAISADGRILDAQTVSHNETPTIGGAQLKDGKYNSSFIGLGQSQSEMVDTVAGVTITTNAFKSAVNSAFLAFNFLKEKESEPVNQTYTLGMGTVVSLDSSKTGTAQVDATVATVVLDKDGKIVFCRIDAAYNKVDITYGFYTIPDSFKTKQELLYDYNMSKYGSDNNGDGIVLEWFEQAKLFEEYVVGMTVEEVEAMTTQTTPYGYIISADDELLNAGCTIQITEFKNAVIKACIDDQAVKFECEGEFTLGLAINSYNDGSKDAEEADGVVQVYSDMAAVVVADGKILAALNDAIQPKIGFDWEGCITTKTFKGTKRELKEAYGMSTSPYSPDNNGDGIVLEWYIQSAEFSKYVIGLTPAEVANLATQTLVNGYIISADNTLLNAGCTIQITGFQAVVAKAANNAR